MINKVVLVGRLTKDPELRYMGEGQGTPRATFTLAVSRPFTNQSSGEREADFIPIIVWRKKAEDVKKYLTKGSLVGVEGRIQTRSYDDNQGIRKFVTEIVSDNVYFLESKGAQGDQLGSQLRDQSSDNQTDEDEFKYENVKLTGELSDDLPF
jgi:single-strand DNA-binding protein